jgi:hypothetical protein
MGNSLSMYNAGLIAATRYIVDERPGYVCPLCLEVIRDPCALSQEHVPPEALGGRPICLTCKKCNPGAGHSIDAAMAERIAAKRVLAEGRTSKKFVKMKLGELSINATVQNYRISIAENHNNPATIEEFKKRYQTMGPERIVQVWYPHKFNDHFEMVGYLKTAYFYAFAKFGYEYILSDCMPSYRKRSVSQMLLRSY